MGGERRSCQAVVQRTRAMAAETATAAATATATATAAGATDTAPLLLHRALPLLLSEPSVDVVESWHRSVLPSQSPRGTAVRRDVLFVSAVLVFASLHFLLHRWARKLGGREGRLGRVWGGWSALQRLECISYAVSTVHAVVASVAAVVAITHSLRLFHSQSQPHTVDGLWAAVSWFVATSLHPLLSALPASLSSHSPSHPSSDSAFELALSCVFDSSAVRDCCLTVTAAYLLVDLVLCLASTNISQQATDGRRVQLASPLIVLHHTLILAAFAWGVLSQTGTLYMTGLLLNELSTPALNANYFLSASQLSSDYPRLYVCNAVVLLLLFVVARVLWNGGLLCHIVLFSWVELQPLWRSDSRWLMPYNVRWRCAALTALCCGHVAINAVWAVQLGRAVHRKWRRSHTAATSVHHTNPHSNSHSKNKQL